MSDSDLRTWLVICDRAVGPEAAATVAPLPPAALVLVRADGTCLPRRKAGRRRRPRRRQVICQTCRGYGWVDADSGKA